MRTQNLLAGIVTTLGLAAVVATAGCVAVSEARPKVELPVQPVPLGDYEPVVPWPKPLPDTDLQHAGWTWGSGSGVWAENPDKVWVSQRAEIELPPGATPWICPCLLNPRRTNTGRRAYSGKDYPYRQRRHHLVFTVDRNGNTINEWLQHDAYLRPDRGTGLGELARGPHKLLINPYDPQKLIWIVDDDMHEINIFTNDGKLVKTMGERGVPGRGPNNFNRPTDITWLPDGTFFVADGYAGTRVAKFDKDGKFLMDLGRPPADPSNPVRTSSGRCTVSGSAVTGGSSSRIGSTTGCRSSTRTASSSRCGRPATTRRCSPTSSPRTTTSGWPTGRPIGW